MKFELGLAIDTADALAYVESFNDAVVLAVGMGPDADVAYPGDELPGVWNSLPFIEAIKTGSPPDVGELVAVIGGGNTAIDVAREALRLGAHDVTLGSNRRYSRGNAGVRARESRMRFEEGLQYRMVDGAAAASSAAVCWK